MTLDQWIAAAASVSTVIAAVLAAISLRVIRRQNALQYLPRITIEETWINAKIDRSNCVWLNIDSKMQHASSEDFRIRLLNVGNGVATHLTIQWQYDVETWINACRATSADSDTAPAISSKEGWIDLSGKGFKTMIRRPETNTESLDYLVPVTVQTADRSILFDYALRVLVAYYYSHASAKDWDRVPKEITLSVKYRDTLGNNHSELIPIRLSLAIWRHASEDKQAEATFRIERAANST